jgi:hypothetical protein
MVVEQSGKKGWGVGKEGPFETKKSQKIVNFSK